MATKKQRSDKDLGARERQILEVVYRIQPASVSEVLNGLENPPSYSAVRTMLGLLESKGHVRRRRHGIRFLYLPTESRQSAGRKAISNLMVTFFEGSASKTFAALLDESASELSEEEINLLQNTIDQARKREISSEN